MTRIEREKIMVGRMIRFYCRKYEKNAALCTDCAELLEYALKRLDRCVYGENKPACKKCPTHCYAPQYRKKIREIMRFSGPWMLLYHPIGTVRHWLLK